MSSEVIARGLELGKSVTTEHACEEKTAAWHRTALRENKRPSPLVPTCALPAINAGLGTRGIVSSTDANKSAGQLCLDGESTGSEAPAVGLGHLHLVLRQVERNHCRFDELLVRCCV